jgi:tetrapyrrole methylase family protein/MazG family protein
MTTSTRLSLEGPTVRVRTRHHPALAGLDLPSYDDLYDAAESFDQLYDAIVDDLVELALRHDEVVYAVPGSPLVAESTVERLRDRKEVQVLIEPAVSVLDVAAIALGIDPMAVGLRILDALGPAESFRGPGPWLLLQTYSSSIMAHVADRLGPQTPVVLVHHAGLDDQVVREMTAAELIRGPVDHLTSVYVPRVRGVGDAVEDLVELARTLRAQCPWDQEQTHGSLARHLVEESYEALEALENLATLESRGEVDEAASLHVREELGDLLYQIVFHAELADEVGSFDLHGVVEALSAKLISRHPHVFGDVDVSTAAEVESRWEELKRAEKGRESVTDGVPPGLPALALVQKLARRGAGVGLAGPLATSGDSLVVNLVQPVSPETLASALEALVELGSRAHLDVEGVLRDRARDVRERIREHEGLNLT